MADMTHPGARLAEDGSAVGLAADGLVIAVLTYRRPEDIALALPRLAGQAGMRQAGSGTATGTTRRRNGPPRCW